MRAAVSVISEQEQNDKSRYAENADDKRVYERDRDGYPDNVAEKVHDHQTDKAAQRVDEELENKAYRLREKFNKNNDREDQRGYQDYVVQIHLFTFRERDI